jgi:hypothetical protein
VHFRLLEIEKKGKQRDREKGEWSSGPKKGNRETEK